MKQIWLKKKKKYNTRMFWPYLSIFAMLSAAKKWVTITQISFIIYGYRNSQINSFLNSVS